MQPAAEAPLVSRDDLLRKLRNGGVSVSPAQLVRWHRAGLLPRPVRRFLGRGKGTQSRYPEIAVTQAFMIARLLRGTRSFREVRWALWHLGFAGFDDAVRIDLLEELEKLERATAAGFAAFLAEEPGNPIESLATAKRVSRAWGAVRRRVGKQRMDTVAVMLSETMLGVFPQEQAKYSDADDIPVARQAIAAQLGERPLPNVLPSVTRDGLSLVAQELNLPRVRAAVRDAPPRVLIFIRREADTLYRECVPGLPADGASIAPAAFFLLWLGLRWVSPTIATALDAQSKRPGWPTRELPLMHRVAERIAISAPPHEQDKGTSSHTQQRRRGAR